MLSLLLACHGPNSDETDCCIDYYGPYPTGGAWLMTGGEVLAGEPGTPFVPDLSDCGQTVFGAGDLDADGTPDFGTVCAGPWSGRDTLALWSGDGAPLATIEVARFPWGHGPGRLADVDADGHDDLGLPGDEGSGVWARFLGGANIGGTQQAELASVPVTGSEAWWASALLPAGDIDADGRPDVLVAASPTYIAGGGTTPNASVVVWSANDLDGAAALEASGAPHAWLDSSQSLGPTDAVPLGDVNGDGRDDLALLPHPWSAVNDTARDHRARVAVWTGIGESVDFLPYLTGGVPNRSGDAKAVGLGDLDSDGHAELAVLLYTSSSSEDHVIVLAVVPGAAVPAFGSLDVAPFALAPTGPGYDLAACDLDGDGRPELITEAGIWAGDDLLVPGSAPSWPGIDFPVACVGDVDGDGAEELVRGDTGLWP